MKLRVRILTAGWFLILSGCTFLAAVESLAQTRPNTANARFIAVDQGPHHQVKEAWDEKGELLSRYTELQTGLMRQEADGSWVESSDEIEIFEDRGAVARKTRHQVILSPDSAPQDGDAVFDILTPDKKRLRGRCVGLAYTEQKTGRSVFIAEIKSAGGLVVGRNEVIYPDCFDGVNASLRYRVTLAGISQDVILEQAAPDPAIFGLDPNNDVMLEVWTHFSEAPMATNHIHEVQTKTGRVKTDATVDFGEMRIGDGKAFPLSDPNGHGNEARSHELKVHKEYETIDGLQFLIESVHFDEVAPLLEALPAAPQASVDQKRLQRAFATAGKNGRSRPVSFLEHDKSKRSVATKMRRSSDQPLYASAGYVLDFELNAGSLTNFVFRGDTTYYVRGTVHLYGTTTLEGAVIKYAPYSDNPQLRVATGGNLVMKTEQYRPAILCAKDDNGAGYVISGSTGYPSGYYAFYALAYFSATPLTISNVRVLDAKTGFYLGEHHSGISNILKHVQMVRCETSVITVGTDLQLRNVLFADGVDTFYNDRSDIVGEHVTFNNFTTFYYGTAPLSFTFTNSLFVNVGGYPSFSGQSNVITSDTNTFQAVVAGRHYLADGSLYRQSGVPNINPDLAADLNRRTTSPPIFLTDKFTADQRWVPRAARGGDKPDLGYHYDPLDYLIYNAWGTNIEVTVSPGTALGAVASSFVSLKENTTLTAHGTAANPIRFTHCNQVQEDSWNQYYYSDYMGVRFHTYNADSASFDFTHWTSCSGYQDEALVYGWWLGPPEITIKNSIFNGGTFRWANADLAVSNCFLHRIAVKPGSPTGQPANWQNVTFHGGQVDFNWVNGNFSVKDSFFDGTTLVNTNSTIKHDFNAYVSGANRLPQSGTNGLNDVIVVNPMNYAEGPLGGYYQTHNSLLNEGSTSASNVGLFHFTSHISVARETNSTVDIGFHYPYVGNGEQPKVRFMGVDRTTMGNWKGTYGAEGYHVAQDSSSYPGYFGMTLSGNANYTWSSAPVEARALERGTSGRIAACWYSGGNFEFSITQSDSLPHRFALYCLDWDAGGRGQRIEIRDSVSGALLDSQAIYNFRDGAYLIWEIVGNFKAKVVWEAGPNVVVSGFFLDAGTKSAEVSTNGLVGHWRFDEGIGTTTADSSATANHGELLNAASWAPGRRGPTSLALDGANDYASVPDDTSLQISGDITIAFWMKRHADPSEWSRIVGKGAWSLRNYGVWEEYSSSGRLLFQQYDVAASMYFDLYTTSSLSTGVWYHVAAVVNGTTGSFYINGVLDATGTRPGVPSVSTEPLTFGYAGYHTYFPGDIDDVRIYNRSLSSAEVLSLAGEVPYDTDNDGLPNFLEDSNGNGYFDWGESLLDIPDAGPFDVFITQPRQGQNLAGAAGCSV